jgi:2'-5' RNA ligase
LRSFIAIELPDTAKSALENIQRGFGKCGADVRWVNAENIHLTLKFLGNIKEEMVDDIVGIIESACSLINRFELKIKGLGMFPNSRSPRVLWVGISGGGDLYDLQKGIENGMASLGFAVENRSFKPHLTLGRFKSRVGIECLRDIVRQHEEDDYLTVHVKSVVLMRSDLQPSGPRYYKIAEFPLGRSGAGI